MAQLETITLRREDGDTCIINANDAEMLQAMNEKGFFSEAQWAEAEDPKEE